MATGSISSKKSMSSVEKEKQRRRREQATERARAARNRERQKSSRPNKKQPSSRIRVATNRFSPAPPAPPPPKSTPPSRKAELDSLHEKKLVKVLNQHFSTIAAHIAKEKAENDAKLADLERKKKEGALHSPAAIHHDKKNSLVGFDALFVQLRKQNDKIRKKEAETKQLYHKWVSRIADTDDDRCEKQNLKKALLAAKALPANYFSQSDLKAFQEKDRVELTREHVPKVVKQYDDAAAQEVANVNAQAKDYAEMKRERVPLVAKQIDDAAAAKGVTAQEVSPRVYKHQFVPRPSSQEDLEEAEKAMMEEAEDEEAEKTLMEEAQARAIAAEQDGVMEEALLQVELAEENARIMEQAMDWVTLSKIGAATENTKSPAENESRVDNDNDSAEMRLAAFLQAETDAISSISSTDDEETSSFSASTAAREANDAAIAAEKAAKEMAEAVSFTSQSESEEEEWFAYWSEEYQREYYYEPKSGKVVWTIPDMSTPTITSSYHEASDAVSDGAATVSRSLPTVQEASTYSSDHPPSWQDFIEVSSSSDSVARRKRQRKRRKKRLIRRVIYAVVASSTIIAAAVYYRYWNVEDSAAKALSRVERNRNLKNSMPFIPDYEEDIIFSSSYSSSSSVKLEKSSTRHESFDAYALDEIIAETTFSLDALRKSGKNVNQIVPQVKSSEKQSRTGETTDESPHSMREVIWGQLNQNSSNYVALDYSKPDSSLVGIFSSLFASDSGESLVVRSDDDTKIAMQSDKHPKACFIPLFYIVSSKCRRLAKERPFFNLEALINSMMQ